MKEGAQVTPGTRRFDTVNCPFTNIVQGAQAAGRVDEMPAAPTPKNDDERLAALARYNILDTEAEEIFDRITLMAKSLFNSSIALVSLVDRDRQWFKSRAGIESQQTPRDQAFCSYAILEQEPLVVEDATRDPRFADNPLVTSEPNIRFYAGAPLVTHDGHALGTLCIIDQTPRHLEELDLRLLKELATIAMNEIELRIFKGKETEKRKLSSRDNSTNAYNNTTFQKLFFAECARSQSQRTPLSLAVITLNNLQSVKDTLGQDASDLMITAVANACGSVRRTQDIIARIGPDEFVILMPNTTGMSGEIVVRRVIKRIEENEPQFDGGRIGYSVSVGLAQMSERQGAQDFLKEAQRNCVAAQSAGRNDYVASLAA